MDRPAFANVASGPVWLPAFGDPHSRMLMACGRLTGEGVGESAGEGLQDELCAEFRCGTDMGVVELWASSLKSNHLHLNVFRANYPGKIPKPNTEEATIRRVMDRLVGQQIQVTGTARFEIPIEELPKPGLIRTSLEMMNFRLDNLTMKQTGASFSVEGGTLRKIEWFIVGSTARVEIGTESTTTIGPDYLIRLYNEVLAAFQRWILYTGTTDGATRSG